MSEGRSLEVVKKLPLRQVQSVKELLMNDQAKQQLASVAAKHMSPERMMRVVANSIRTTPKLQQCEPMSFLGALMHCAALGLEPNTPLGHAYLIPFENKRKGVVEVQMILGYKGFLDLARRSGQVVSIHADVVYDDDELFSHEYGSNQHLRHKPGPRAGQKIGAYCYVKLRHGDANAEGHIYLTKDQILRIRDKFSQGWQTAVRFGKTAESPWTIHEDAMWSKTAVRAMANRGELPMSIEFMEALTADEGRADYRTFAMDPTAGVTIEPEGEEAPPEDSAPVNQIEEAQTLPTAPAKPAQEPEKVEAKREPEKPAEKPQEAPADDGAIRSAMLAHPDFSRALNDMADFPVDDVLELQKVRLARLKETFPDLHGAFMAEVAEYRKAEAEKKGAD